MLQIRHAELLADVAWAIRAVGPANAELEIEVAAIEADHDLVRDLAMDGRRISQALELLEERLSTTLPHSLAIDLVIAGPTVGRLVRLLARMKEEARHAR